MKIFTSGFIRCGLTMGLLSAISASAATITFNAVPSSGNPLVTALTTDGFNFTSLHFHTIDNPGLAGFGGEVGNGTIFISEEAGSLGRPITMTPASGGVFALNSLDAAKVFNNNNQALEGGFPNADTLVVMGFLHSGGTVSASFSLANAFQTFFLPGTFTALDSVIFSGALVTGAPGGISLDNIGVNNAVNNAPDAASTLALLSGAMAGLSLLRKK